jgi:hypothetical protein
MDPIILDHGELCTDMQMQSLLEVNRANERFRHRQLMSKVARKFQQASKQNMSLKKRYEISIESLKIQLRSLKISAGVNSLISGKVKFSRGSRCSEPRPSSNADPRPSPCKPKLVSESSSDNESDMIDLQSSDEDLHECEMLMERRNALVGQTVVGRLNIYSPREGFTRYYLNWTTNKLDNIRIDYDVIEKCIGFGNLRPGMPLLGTISHLGPECVRWDKQRPYAGSVKFAPRIRERKNRRYSLKGRRNRCRRQTRRQRHRTRSY